MLQMAVSRGQREPVIIFLAVMAIGLAVAFYLYFAVDKYSLLYYWDAVSHLVASRKLADWGENPGLGQIGTVWMPLPHFLLFPFAMVDLLFTSGFAGLALSLPCLALTSVFLYKIVKALKIPGIAAVATVPSFAAIAGALLYATNPSILYLGLTSMTEAPFMLFFVASAYYFQMWYQNGNRLRNLILCSVFLSFATLCKYEGWFLPVFLVIVAGVFAIKKKAGNDPREHDARKKKAALVMLASFLSLSSIVFWLVWNQYHYGDAFEFSNAQYYSASWYAQHRPFRELLFLQPMNVLSVYGVTALAMYGPLLLGAGAMGYYYFFRKARIDGKKIVLLFLALPPLFTIVSLLVGIGEMSYWFNSRFMVLLSPLVIVMACIFLARVYYNGTAKKNDNNSNNKRTIVIIAAVGALFASQLSVLAFSTVVTMDDAKGGYFLKENQLAIKTGEALKSLYDGNGSIMILTGSGLEQRVMITSGIALRNFDEIIEPSTWKASFKEPWSYDRWVVITTHPGSDAINTTNYWLGRQDDLATHYNTVYENEYYRIMVLR